MGKLLDDLLGIYWWIPIVLFWVVIFYYGHKAEQEERRKEVVAENKLHQEIEDEIKTLPLDELQRFETKYVKAKKPVETKAEFAIRDQKRANKAIFWLNVRHTLVFIILPILVIGGIVTAISLSNPKPISPAAAVLFYILMTRDSK